MFLQIQQMAQQNPSLLPPLLQQLADTYPELYQRFAQNPKLLSQLLAGLSEGEDMRGGEEGGGIPPDAEAVELSKGDRDAIDRTVQELLLAKLSSAGAPPSQPPALQAPSTAPSAPTIQQPATAQTGNLFQAAQQAAQQQDGPGLQNSSAQPQPQQSIHQNPALIQPLIEQLAMSNPNLAEALTQNPDLLYQFLEGMEGVEGDHEGGPIPPGAIGMIRRDLEAVDRLVALGFPWEAATKAYLVRGKSEELAATYLSEGAFD
ncbi:hypothetical protein FS837_011546 [Tulasnella sp. UAMH 9824]|nr:hypothetical protein FS837_011546 [Tulasnella sp. UAMH 9824]